MVFSCRNACAYTHTHSTYTQYTKRFVVPPATCCAAQADAQKYVSERRACARPRNQSKYGVRRFFNCNPQSNSTCILLATKESVAPERAGFVQPYVHRLTGRKKRDGVRGGRKGDGACLTIRRFSCSCAAARSIKSDRRRTARPYKKYDRARLFSSFFYYLHMMMSENVSRLSRTYGGNTATSQHQIRRVHVGGYIVLSAHRGF